MKIGKYIHELLLENETVIIPGFGAFISNYKPAEINEETKELKPPSKEIFFNKQIRNNDGLLVGSIALGEGISHFDALKKIEKERENIIYQLDKGENVTLEETGELTVNDKNEIQFKPFEIDNLLLDSFGLEAVSIKEAIEKKEAVEIIKEKTEPEKKKPVPIVEAKKEIPEPLPIPEKEKMKKRSGLWLLLILIPIIAVGIYIKNKNTDFEKPIVESKEKPAATEKEKPVLKPDTIVLDTAPVLSQDTFKKELDKPVDIADPNSPKFYLVGGSFKEEKNAEKYLIQLKEKGFEPFQLGKRGNFYIIGIGTYNSGKEALEAKRKFTTNNPGSGVWIMEEE